jgi:hypothetical protein
MGLATITVAMAVAAISGQAAAESADRHEFTFERTKIGDFELNATTEIDWRDQVPFVRDISCTGDNQDISFVVDEAGKLERMRMAFLGLPEPDGDRPHITLLGDALWLFVDGKRYEYRNIRWPSERFTNYSYRPAPKPEIVLPVWRGYQAIRASGSDPFINASAIYGDILRSTTLEWSFKSRNWNQVDRSVPETRCLKAGKAGGTPSTIET